MGDDKKEGQEDEEPAPAAAPAAAAPAAAAPAAAAASRSEPQERTEYKGGTITLKSDCFKVLIPKKKSRSGKECAVQKKFGGKQTREAAFAAAKVYIDERVA